MLPSYHSVAWASMLFNVLIWSLYHQKSLFSAAFLAGRVCSSYERIPVPRKQAENSVIRRRGFAILDTAVDASKHDDTLLLDECLSVAVDAARRAGEIIRSYDQGAAVVDQKANSRDLLTIVDPLCEKIIRETIHQAFPTHRFLGEEGVAPGAQASANALQTQLAVDTSVEPFLWIVDPIDGTTNFVHGMPLCMPSIALVDTTTREILIGVIYDCHRQELFTAVQSRGAFLNGTPIRVGAQERLGDAVVAMGSPPSEESYSKSLQGIQYLMPKVRTIRMLGSAALMLAWVANGRLTAYWEYDLSSWDTAAGVLLIQEAGGKVTDLRGDDFTVETRQLCASNGNIHAELIQTLRDEAGIW